MDFECKFCGKNFASNYSLERHESTMHSNRTFSKLDAENESGNSDDDEMSYVSDSEDSTGSSDDSANDEEELRDLKNDVIFQDIKRKAFNSHQDEIEELGEHFGDIDHKKKIKKIRHKVCPKVCKTIVKMIQKKIVNCDRLRRSKLFRLIQETIDQIREEGVPREEAIRRAVEKRKYLIQALIESDDWSEDETNESELSANERSSDNEDED